MFGISSIVIIERSEDLKETSIVQKRKRVSNKSSPSSSKRRSLTNARHSEAENAESCSLTDAGLIALANGFPRIENLSLIWCPNVSSFGLSSLAHKCTSLKSLDLQVML